MGIGVTGATVIGWLWTGLNWKNEQNYKGHIYISVRKWDIM